MSTSPFNQHPILTTIVGVLDDEENDSFLIIGPDGKVYVLEEQQDGGFLLEEQEFSQC